MGSLQAHMMFWEWDTSHYCLNLECLHADAKGHLVHNLETQVTLKSSSFWLLANKKRLKTFTFWALFFNGFDLNPVEMVQSTCTTSQSDTALSVQEQNLTIPALHSTQSPGVLACFCCALMTERGKMTVWVSARDRLENCWKRNMDFTVSASAFILTWPLPFASFKTQWEHTRLLLIWIQHTHLRLHSLHLSFK